MSSPWSPGRVWPEPTRRDLDRGVHRRNRAPSRTNTSPPPHTEAALGEARDLFASLGYELALAETEALLAQATAAAP
jgi:hypothetical protein